MSRPRTSSNAMWYALFLFMIPLALVVAVSFTDLRPAPPRKPVMVSRTRGMLSTYVTLKVVARTKARAQADIAAGFNRIAELGRILNARDPNSELSRLNARAGQGPVAVSDDLYRAVASGAAWHERTDGAFDIAIGPLLDLWRACGKEDRPPAEEEIEQAQSLCGADRILLDPAARTIALPDAGMRLDLGGHGKGFIADEVEKLFLKRGVKNALISMSGDIRAMGRTAEGAPWRIGIEDPRPPRSEAERILQGNTESSGAFVAVLELTGRSVSTSGDYERFVEIGGKRYSHIVDPRTGQPAEGVHSVTVIGPDTITTDVLDTALSVLGLEDGLDLVETLPQVEALFVTADANGDLRVTRSKGFAAYEAKE